MIREAARRTRLEQQIESSGDLSNDVLIKWRDQATILGRNDISI